MKKIEILSMVHHNGIPVHPGSRISVSDHEAKGYIDQGLAKELIIPENRQRK